MRTNILFLLLFLGGGISSALFSKLREEDIRLSTLMNKEPAEIKNKANQFLLNYQGMDGNFLVFYDYEQTVIYLRYRIDRWDFTTKEIPHKLKEGLTYKVDFVVQGFCFEKPIGNEEPIVMEAKLQACEKESKNLLIRNKKKILLGSYQKAIYILPDIIRY